MWGWARVGCEACTQGRVCASRGERSRRRLGEDVNTALDAVDIEDLDGELRAVNTDLGHAALVNAFTEGWKLPSCERWDLFRERLWRWQSGKSWCGLRVSNFSLLRCTPHCDGCGGGRKASGNARQAKASGIFCRYFLLDLFGRLNRPPTFQTDRVA